MNKARKRFVLFSILCVFLLLFVLLGIINGLNFTMASEDADRVTWMLAQQNGEFVNLPEAGFQNPDSSIRKSQGGKQKVVIPPVQNPQDVLPGTVPSGFMGHFRTNSRDMEFSLRYFTYSFDQDGNAEQVAFQISAVTEDEALAWARSLQKEHETGWTRLSYRYRVYRNDGKTYVTVIDQGRELLPSFRILLISAIGLFAGMIVSAVLLMYIGRRLFKPLEEADRKQKLFIAKAEKEFKVPLTIINADTEIMERESGETDQTLSINRQVKKMLGLVKNLSSMAVFEEKELTKLQCDLSALSQEIGDAMKDRFAGRNRILEVTSDPAVIIQGDSEAMSQLISELLENALKFSVSRARLKAGREKGRSEIIAINDTTLPDGNYDQVFDRFTRLENAGDLPGAGLGLSHVKEIVQAHNGRAYARVMNGEFILRISL